MKILFSTSYVSRLNIKDKVIRKHDITFVARLSDWGKKGLAKYLHHIIEAIRILKLARRFDVLVICTAGIEVFVVSKWRWLFCPRTNIVCVDPIMPKESLLVKLVRGWIKEADAFVCIRKGDIVTLGQRFAVPTSKCFFTYFPADESVVQMQTSEGDYIYSTGWAHRDWETLIFALSELPYRAILSTNNKLDIPDECRNRIEVIPIKSPEEGRKIMADARIVTLSFEETNLPSGPLVLLDAMVMGKPLVVTDVNGTRDYVNNGKTALVVPPKNKEAMKKSIKKIMEDSELRRNIIQAARTMAGEQFTIGNLFHKIEEVCEKVQKAQAK